MESYFRYLYDMIEEPYLWWHGYETVARVLLDIEFIPHVSNDENRASDGLELRADYGRRIFGISEKCTMLEMLISLCERIQWEMQDEVEDNSLGRWFTEIVNNLGIDEDCEDENYIRGVVFAARDREYRYDGLGGYFPLRNPEKDQRKVEIWYQMQAYLIENY